MMGSLISGDWNIADVSTVDKVCTNAKWFVL
jgi:hypothetical protein